jgi:hypothetical protein
MTINPDAMRALLHSPEVVAPITERAQNIADSANLMAVHVGRSDRPEPEYGVRISNVSAQTRARTTVYPRNYQAVLDDAINSTLYTSRG